MSKSIFLIASLIVLGSLGCVYGEEETTKGTETDKKEEEVIKYVRPEIGDLAHIAEPFHDKAEFESRWVSSKAKKDGVDDSIAKYDGKWDIEEPEGSAIEGDLGLILKSEAKHAAISSKLPTRFEFQGNALFVQYEVRFQKALECGGAYIKLLADLPGLSLDEFGDKTQYTIMFGPDKCGHDGKLHFIVQHENPISGKSIEHHAKAATGDFSKIFDDKKTHLVTLIVRPGNTFEILVDRKSVNSGSLLNDLEPPINPPKEIDDPEDKKPEDWDEREKIPDPDATKPDDWDEDAPKRIVDSSAVKPSTWLDNEPEHIPDPNAVRPNDWDDEEDGEWEAPQIPNPQCKDGNCGEWKAPYIDNPNYKGKWSPALIANPAYKGIWKPKKIENPDFFEDPNPFGNLKPIAAVGYELWSMQSDITFDNIILASDQSTLDQWTAQTWDLKHSKEVKAEPGVVSGAMDSLLTAANEQPWLYVLYAAVVLLPLILIYVFCFPSKDRTSERKKTDEPTPDDPVSEEEIIQDEDVPVESEVLDDSEAVEDSEAVTESEAIDESEAVDESEPIEDSEPVSESVAASLEEEVDGETETKEESEPEVDEKKEEAEPEVAKVEDEPTAHTPSTEAAEESSDEQSAVEEVPVKEEEVVEKVEEKKDDSADEQQEKVDEDEQSKPEEVQEISQDVSPQTSPRATRSKRKTRKDT